MIVPVNSRFSPYDVHIVPGALQRLDESLGEAVRVAIIVPEPLGALAERVGERCRGRSVTTITVPDAEAAKTPVVLVRCWDELAAAGFTRSDLVIGVGGGTATDLAGFVAASWLRGIGFISIPTTVLGMVDAAVGGKTGINLTAGKNLVGAFHEPRVVLCDLDLLRELPPSEVASGLAEVVKCGFISDAEILRLVDSEVHNALEVTSDIFAELVGRAVAVKARVVATDLTERTSRGEIVGREALNYGHTLGHAIEAHDHYRLRHGRAISVGMVWIAEVSRRLLGLDSSLAADHSRLLGALGLPTSYDAAAWPELRRLMSLDKKTRGTSLRLVGLAAQGHPVILNSPDEGELAGSYAVVSGHGPGSGKIHRRPLQTRVGKAAGVVSTNDLKNGMVLDLNGELWQVQWFQHHKPGKGNTVVRSKLKNVLSGKIVDKTFNSDTKVDTATIDRRDMQYLYLDGEDYVFMDNTTYDQIHVSADVVGEDRFYLLDNQTATVALHEGTPLFIELPASVELEITYTEPGLQGDRSTGGTKPATLETGKEIQVPLFITTGEKIKVDTRDGSYISRVNG